MRKIFIFGIGGFGKSAKPVLPDSVKTKIDSMIQNKVQFLVGDCQGIDTLVQQYLKSKNYKDVTVYYSGTKCRNKIDPEWSNKSVTTHDTGRAFYTAKDIKACEDANEGLAVWDGLSAGTRRNIDQLKTAQKHVEIYRIDKGGFDFNPPDKYDKYHLSL